MSSSSNRTSDITSRSTSCPRLLLYGEDDCHTRHLAPALLHNLEHLPCHVLDVTSLFEETGRAAEETIIQKVKTARHTLPSLLYVPDILAWWDLAGDAARVVFTSLMKGLDRSVHMLLLTTIKCTVDDIPPEIIELFDQHQGETYEVVSPGATERLSFFQQLFSKTTVKSDDISTRSSYVDFIQVMGPRKMKTEPKRQKEVEIIEAPVTRRSKARTKMSVVNSSPSPSGSNPRISVKRELSASGEGVTSKRQRVSGSLSGNLNSLESLTESQVQELLDRAVEYTEEWPSQQLEALYSALDLTLERTVDDVYTAVTDCMENFHKYKQSPGSIFKSKD